MNTDLHFSSKTDQRATPQDFFDKLNERFNFNLDPACNEFNCKTEIGFYYNTGMDGLKERWSILEDNYHTRMICFDRFPGKRSRVFCNPPYGRGLKDWVKKASEEIKKDYCDLIVMLIPARTDTRYFHEYIYNKPNVKVEFIKGRLKFGDSKNSAPFPSMLVIFNSKQE